MSQDQTVPNRTIHKWFPGGAPAPVHDPETNEVTGK